MPQVRRLSDSAGGQMFLPGRKRLLQGGLLQVSGVFLWLAFSFILFFPIISKVSLFRLTGLSQPRGYVKPPAVPLGVAKEKVTDSRGNLAFDGLAHNFRSLQSSS